MSVRCEIEGCHEPAAVHVLHPRRRICSACAADLTASKYPRCTLVLQMSATAEALRQAATELDDLAGTAPLYELGTLRRKAQGVIAATLAFAQGTVAE
ncbi:MAG: hypothetical protein WDO69_22705 [Pseudomonadota bacterium]